MIGKIKLRRSTGPEEFEDADLRRAAAKLREHDRSGCFATVPYELHAYAARRLDLEAKKLSLSAPEDYSNAMRIVMDSHPHLAYLVMCQFHDDKRADVEITEDSDHD